MPSNRPPQRSLTDSRKKYNGLKRDHSWIPTEFSDLTKSNLEGRATEALDMIATLPRTVVRDGALDLYRKGRLKDRRRAQALFALWTEVVVEAYQGIFDDPRKTPDPKWPDFACRWVGPVFARDNRSVYGRAVIMAGETFPSTFERRSKPTTAFLEAWYLVFLAHYQGGGPLAREDCLRVAPDRVKNTPEMLLAVGRHQENVWYFAKEANWPQRVIADLKEGEQALKMALELVPTLDEARLRLGRVTVLMGDEDEGLRLLATVVGPMDPKFVYLARMFEAEVYERRGDLTRAQEAYEQGLVSYSSGQSARVGLARVLFTRGLRDQAQSSLDWFDEPNNIPAQRDPWAEYYYGFEGQLEKYRERLRAAVRTN